MSIIDIIRLERMTYAEKLRHWGGDAPWQVAGRRLRLPKPEHDIRRGHLEVERGHIRRMRALIGRPCFGSPIAYLRHGRQAPFFNPRTARLTPTRCMQCPVQDACHYVAEERLHASPEIIEARQQFESAGGPRAITDKNASRSWVVPWRNLIRVLEEHGPFENVNDMVVASWCNEQERLHKVQERERKRRARKKALEEKTKRAEFPPEVMRALDRERIYRRARYRSALEHTSTPRRFIQAGRDGADFDTHVWMARELLRASDRPQTSYSLAKELRRLGVDHRPVNALRVRVEGSLQRIHQLARLRVGNDSEPVLPPLNFRALIAEVAETTPYENEEH